MKSFFNFEPFTDAELEGFSPEQLTIELQFMRAVFSALAAISGEHTLTPIVGGKVRGL